MLPVEFCNLITFIDREVFQMLSVLLQGAEKSFLPEDEVFRQTDGFKLPAGQVGLIEEMTEIFLCANAVIVICSWSLSIVIDHLPRSHQCPATHRRHGNPRSTRGIRHDEMSCLKWIQLL